MMDSYADPGTPDHRSAARYLWWLTMSQRRRVVGGAVLGTLWMVCLMLPPYLMERAIDDGLQPGRTAVLVGWVAALIGVALLNAWLGIMRHRTMTRVRMDATFRTLTDSPWASSASRWRSCCWAASPGTSGTASVSGPWRGSASDSSSGHSPCPPRWSSARAPVT